MRTVKSASRVAAAGAPGTRRARRRDSVATREALLAAGTDLFAERGYDGVPVAVIAHKAGVNKAMINYHFGGKRKLYVAIVSATFAEIVGEVERLAESPRPAPEVLREVVAGARHLEPEVMDKPARMLDAVRTIVARGVREGDFRSVDPLLTHLSLVGSLVFFFATKRFRDRVLAKRRPALEPPDAAAFVKHTQDLLTYGLAASQPASDGA
jgi:AcrR family transcriptional regulator